VLTMILAIYGAVVATASALLSAWIFRASGPRLQAQARFQPGIVTSKDTDTGDRTLIVKVWNTGRSSIKVDLEGLTIRHPSGAETFIPMYWHGPDLPIWIPGHSGEEWWEDVARVSDYLEAPFESNEISIDVIGGGNRRCEIKVPGSHLRHIIEHPAISEAESHDPREP
jgi:hypothetical protein